MEFAAIALTVVTVLLPGIKGLLDSVAYRNRAWGKAEIIRAKRGIQTPQAMKRPEEGRGKDHG